MTACVLRLSSTRFSQALSALSGPQGRRQPELRAVCAFSRARLPGDADHPVQRQAGTSHQKGDRSYVLRNWGPERASLAGLLLRELEEHEVVEKREQVALFLL